MTSTDRPCLTSVDKHVLKGLVKGLAKTESQFCCGGVIQLPAERKPRLLYEVGDGDHAHSLKLPPTRTDELQQLLEACVPSSHGRGNETVFDETYRLARELQQDTFALTMDILNESGVMASISALTSPRTSNSGLVADLYKLNAYGKGGFFKPHRDTPKSARHIGTVVVALPIPFEGGDLRVSHEGKEVLFEWGTTCSTSLQGRMALPWAFLFSDVEHEVLPVKSGTRVTLAYDIFTSKETAPSCAPVMDGMSLPFYADLKAALNNKDFLPQGGKVAVALSHAYPISSQSLLETFASHLKGSDAALHRVLLVSGLTMELRGVHSPQDVWDEYKEYPNHDKFGPRGGTYHREIMFTSDSAKVKFYEGDDMWQDGDVELLKSQYGARVEPDLIWARKPRPKAFSNSGYYVAYGNEASLGTLYAAAAFILHIPAIGQGARANTV
ncbi:hypothetical protein JB92DRAFT_3104369 [Gautieria morchelliformis]|nr:hypothetical protein JB92DRAFT_3104369 [Gautieria morchelliformis]